MFFLCLQTAKSQDSCGIRISLLTCAPGAELYSTFGHTALRVQNVSANTDYVYNYGTFEFGPDFYMQFIRGKLLYFLSVEDYADFEYQYQMESRSIQEQVLYLNCGEKERLLAALNTNAQEQNRYYKYDFLFDNCTTRAGQIVAANTDSVTRFTPVYKNGIPSFREMIHSYLDKGNQPWSKLGIDILLGAKLDRQATAAEALFLPDNMMAGFTNASTGTDTLASEPQTILVMPSALGPSSFFTPFVVFGILFLVIAAISFASKKWSKKLLLIFDWLFFFFLGMAGLLLLFMWFGTDHQVCANNYNLLWALPSHIVAAFFVHSKKAWVKKYFLAVFALSILLGLAWFFLPQQMNNGLLPILLLIIFRSWKLSRH